MSASFDCTALMLRVKRQIVEARRAGASKTDIYVADPKPYWFVHDTLVKEGYKVTRYQTDGHDQSFYYIVVHLDDDTT